MAKKVDLVVVKQFRDKLDHVTIYEPGTELSFPADRAADLVKRGLAELKPEKDDAEETAKAEAKAKEEAEAKAQGEAKAKEEAEAKAQAEAETKAKAEPKTEKAGK